MIKSILIIINFVLVASIISLLWTPATEAQISKIASSYEPIKNTIQAPEPVLKHPVLPKPRLKALSEPKKPRYIREGWTKVRARITHYSWRDDPPYDGKTSLNRSAKNSRGVAVDPRMIPYGSEIYIPGWGYKKADDTGGACRRWARKGVILVDIRHYDVSRARLMKLGVKWIDIWVKFKV